MMMHETPHLEQQKAETEERAVQGSEDLTDLLWGPILTAEESDEQKEISAAEEPDGDKETSAAEEPDGDAESLAAEEPEGEETSAAEEPDGDEETSDAEEPEEKEEENWAVEEPEDDDEETAATEEPGEEDRIEEESDVATTSMSEGETDWESLDNGCHDKPVNSVLRPAMRRRQGDSQSEDGATVEKFRRLKKSDDAELVSDDQSRAESLANDPG
jgi:hypothetical protein